MYDNNITNKKLVILLDKACLKLIDTQPFKSKLVTSEDAPCFFEKNPSERPDARPDILHQCLLMLLECPLNKSGHLQVYIRTTGNELIEVSPQLTVPPTWIQFEAMMISFLKKKVIRAVENSTVLLKNDLNLILPVGACKIGLSFSGKPVKLSEFCSQYKNIDKPIVFFIGCVAKSNPTSKENCKDLEEAINISDSHLTAAICCGKVCSEFEYLWNVV